MRRIRWVYGLGLALMLASTLGACQQESVSTGPSSDLSNMLGSPIDFTTDPSILRGKWTGVGVSDNYGETAFSRDGTLFVACTQKSLSVREVATNTERFGVPCVQPLSMSFSPDASLLVLRDSQMIRVLSAESGEMLASAESKTLPYRITNTPVFNPEGSLFVTDEGFVTNESEKQQLRLWKLTKEADGEVVLTPGAPLGAGGGVTDAAFSFDGRYVAVAEDGQIGLWRVGDGQLVRQYSNNDSTYSVAFGADNSIYIGGEKTIRRVSLTGDPLGSFQTGDFHAKPVVSPNGRYLISNTSSSSNRNLRIWATAGGEQVTTLKVEPPTDPNYGYFYKLAFDDEQNVYVASGYGGVTRYNLGDGTSQVLLRAEPFTVALDLTATYVDKTSYNVTGTFRFGDRTPLPVAGSVCVPEGLKVESEALAVLTSPSICEVYLSVGDDQRPTWTIGGWAPSGSPPASALTVTQGKEHYRFWLTR